MSKPNATKSVLEITKIPLSGGNITPNIWYKRLKYPGGKGDKAHFPAIAILSEIVFWYRGVEVRDEETGDTLGYRKKFKGDKLQRSYRSFADQYGITLKQSRDAVSFLVDKGLITKELRTVATPGKSLSNVLFIDVKPKAIAKLTAPEKQTPSDLEVTPSDLEVTPSDLEVTPSDLEGRRIHISLQKSQQNFSEKSQKTKKPKSGFVSQIEKANDKERLNALADKIAKIAPTDIGTVSSSTKDQLKKLTLSLSKKPNIEAKLPAYEKWWYANDWRGKQGQPPTVWTMSDTWGQFEAAKVAPFGGAANTGPNLTEAQKQRLKELSNG